MKKGICLAFIVLTLVFAGVLPAHARDHEGHGGHGEFIVRGGVWFGPPWWGGPWWWGPPFYPYYPYYPYPYPPDMQEETPVYVQPEQSEEDYYWYYCTNPQGYYPYVKNCPNGWIKVVPSGPSSEGPEE